jgi:transposase-like protein
MSSSDFQLRLATTPVLDDLVREGARAMLQRAVEDEVADYVDRHKHCLDDRGRRRVVRNGHKPTRTVLTCAGPLEVKQPRVDDRRVDENGVRFRFTSRILPPYLRKSKAVEELVPWLYLKGISSNDMGEALTHFGFDGSGLSPASVGRMKESWVGEYDDWSKRDLSAKRYVYLWADGLYFGCRLTDERPCVLVIMGATAQGTKELIAIHDGERESEQSWKEVLLDLKSRGLSEPPKLAVGDGALGFWQAIGKLWPQVRPQRCWVHKTRNVLNKLPKSQQAAAKAMIHDVWMSATKEDAIKAFDLFVETHRAKFPKAADCLAKDRDELLAFYDFPAEHWSHLRTTNPIESTFATVELRTYRTKGPGSREAGLAMVFKLAQQAQKRWRKLNGHELVQQVIEGVEFVDGERKAA